MYCGFIKRDTELKIIYDCTEDEIQSINNFVNIDQMRALCIKEKIDKEK